MPSNCTREITLNDTWLLGFTDAEGCFHVSFPVNNNSYKILFELAQKGEENKKIVLERLVQLFGVGKVYKHYHINNWSYRVNSLPNTKVLMIYFDNPKFSFLTKKATSYLIWKQIHNSISHKEHLDWVKRQKLISLSKTVNAYSE